MCHSKVFTFATQKTPLFSNFFAIFGNFLANFTFFDDFSMFLKLSSDHFELSNGITPFSVDLRKYFPSYLASSSLKMASEGNGSERELEISEGR